MSVSLVKPTNRIKLQIQRARRACWDIFLHVLSCARFLFLLNFFCRFFFLAIAYPPPTTKIKWAVPNCSHCRLLVARNVTLKGKKKVRKKLNQAPFCNPRKAFWSYAVADPGEGLPPPPAPPNFWTKLRPEPRPGYKN